VLDGKSNAVVYHGVVVGTYENSSLSSQLLIKTIAPDLFLENDGTVTLSHEGKTTHFDHADLTFEEISTSLSVYLLPDAKTGAISLFDPSHASAVVKKAGKLRYKRSIHSASTAEVIEQEHVSVVSSNKDWSFIQKEDGRFGYIKTSYLVITPLTDGLTPDASPKEPISVVWDQGGYTSAKALKGIDVLSPTWFSLADDTGTIHSKANAAYVQDAHAHGIKVWALFDNGFDTDRTKAALSTFGTRQTMLANLLAYVKASGTDGVNFDFENVFESDKERYVQFIREAAMLLHANGLTISIDVTTHSNDPTWSGFLDRSKLGEVVDYMMLMAYDETPQGSTSAGSVASLPWVETGVTRLLEEVPASKVILGVPLYTRVWSGEDAVSANTLSYKFTKNWIAERKLAPTLDAATGQNFIDFKDGSVRKRVWFEDETSLTARFALAKEYKLVGVGAWSRNHADEDTWKTFIPLMQTLK
jgi:spore germination protein YaaH